MPKADVRYYWLTPTDAFADLPAWQVLDLLRYDRATVEPGAPERYALFSAAQRPQLARLASYHVAPAWQTSRAVGLALATAQAWDWYHSHGQALAEAADHRRSAALREVR